MVMIFLSYVYVRECLWKVLEVENSVFSWFRKDVHICKSRAENPTANEQNVSVLGFHNWFMGILVTVTQFW